MGESPCVTQAFDGATGVAVVSLDIVTVAAQ